MYYCGIHVQLLLEHNGDVNSVDASGNSPLHCLCSEEKSIANLPNCISLLVSTTNSYTMALDQCDGVCTYCIYKTMLSGSFQDTTNDQIRTAIATLSLTHIYDMCCHKWRHCSLTYMYNSYNLQLEGQGLKLTWARVLVVVLPIHSLNMKFLVHLFTLSLYIAVMLSSPFHLDYILIRHTLSAKGTVQIQFSMLIHLHTCRLDMVLHWMLKIMRWVV